MREFIRRLSFPSLPTLKIAHQIDQYKNELRAHLDSSGLAEHTLSLLRFLLPSVVSSVDEATSSGCNLARQTMIDLHTKEKAIEYTDGVTGNFLIIMTSTGHIFSQPIIPACNAVEGPVYFTIDWQIKHPDIEEADGTVCGGGASVYYSHTLEMMFFSYMYNNVNKQSGGSTGQT